MSKLELLLLSALRWHAVKLRFDYVVKKGK